MVKCSRISRKKTTARWCCKVGGWRLIVSRQHDNIQTKSPRLFARVIQSVEEKMREFPRNIFLKPTHFEHVSPSD